MTVRGRYLNPNSCALCNTYQNRIPLLRLLIPPHLLVAGLFKHSPAIRVRGIKRHPPFTSLLREERRNFPTFTQIRTETHEKLLAVLPLHYKGKALSERPNKLSALILKSSLFKNLLFNLLCTGVERYSGKVLYCEKLQLHNKGFRCYILDSNQYFSGCERTTIVRM